MRCVRHLGILLLTLFPVASASAAEDSPLPVMIANDNRTPAGQLKNGVLNLQLELREGRWYPEDERGFIETSTLSRRKVTHPKALAR